MNQNTAQQDDGDDDTQLRSKKTVKDATDLQRLKLEKLLKNPDKPVFIPERPKEKKMPKPPEFIRNTWGSSAGAGSGDFHVYRGVRRREYARQKFLDEVTEKKQKDSEYHEKVDENKKLADERTAKKRAKRLKKKQKAKQKKKSNDAKVSTDSESSDSDEEDPKTEETAKTEESSVKEDNSEVEGSIKQRVPNVEEKT